MHPMLRGAANIVSLTARGRMLGAPAAARSWATSGVGLMHWGGSVRGQVHPLLSPHLTSPAYKVFSVASVLDCHGRGNAKRGMCSSATGGEMKLLVERVGGSAVPGGTVSGVLAEGMTILDTAFAKVSPFFVT